MLKLYVKLDDVPETLRGEYKLVDGRYQPDLSDDHPVLVHNKALLTEKSTATARVKELEADIETAKATSLPRGHIAVAKADAELLDKYKALGKPDEVTVKLTEGETLRTESTKRAREDKLVLVAKELDYDNVEAFKRLPDLPDFDIRDGKDGKKAVIALIKEGDKTVEKPALEFLEASPDHAPFLGGLKTAAAGVTVHGSAGGSQQQVDPFASARAWGKQYNDTHQAITSLDQAFGVNKTA